MRIPKTGPYLSLVVLSVVVWFTFPPLCAAGESAENAADAAEVLEKYIEATGGRSAYAALKTRVTKMKLEFKTMGFTANATYFQARPGKSLLRLVGDPIGTFNEGALDGIAWELSSTGGPRLKVGAERAGALRDAVLDGILQWQNLFEKVEYAGSAAIEDRPCHKIVLTPKEGHPETRYYDRQTYMLVKRECVIEHPMGLLQAELYLSDYRRADGVLLPFQMRSTLAGDERLHTVSNIKHNIDFPDDLFALPDEIKALLNRDDGPDASTTREETARP